tara:strand:- start:1364 stop:1702 length:339 start_codon:yes stop_codon:yes gene_type:complete
MSAGRYNIIIDQGSDFSVLFTISEDGSAKNLTGFSARAQMRTTKSASSISATFTCVVTSASEGKITMSLPAATSAALTAGRYFYDLEIFTSSDATVTRLMQGEVDLTQEVTR